MGITTKNESLTCCADVYSLPYYWETNILNSYIIGCYYNHFKEIEGLWGNTDEINELNKRVTIRVHAHYQRDERRFWRISSVWYTDEDNNKYPFMVVLNAGREGDDSYYRVISDTELFLKAENYILQLFKNSSNVENYIKEGLPDKIIKIKIDNEEDDDNNNDNDKYTIITGLHEKVTLKEPIMWSFETGTVYIDGGLEYFHSQGYHETISGEYRARNDNYGWLCTQPYEV